MSSSLAEERGTRARPGTEAGHGPSPDGAAPAVSVLIPAYQAARYIGEALDSVLAQTFGDYEVIVVNDGSPDTEELERALRPYRRRIRYLAQENRGPSGARNAAILAARGEYVALLDSDDVWLPDFLEAQVREMQREPGVDLVYSDALLFGDSRYAGRTFMELTPSEGEATLESLLALRCMVVTSCVLARRSALVEAGLFDESFRHSEDFDLWLRLARRGGRIRYHRRVLARRRLHDASLGADPRRLLEGQIHVYRKAARELDLPPELLEAVEAQLRRSQAHLDLENGKERLARGDYAGARELIAAASRVLRSPKLLAVRVGLRVSPGLLRRLHLRRAGLPAGGAARGG